MSWASNKAFNRHPFPFWQVRVSTYDSSPLSVEDQGKMLRLSITQQRMSPWSWRQEDLGILVPRVQNMSMEYPNLSQEIPVIEMSLPVPANGIVPFHIQLSDEVATLNIEVREKRPFPLVLPR